MDQSNKPSDKSTPKPSRPEPTPLPSSGALVGGDRAPKPALKAASSLTSEDLAILQKLNEHLDFVYRNSNNHLERQFLKDARQVLSKLK
jgi:hypothetical protein